MENNEDFWLRYYNGSSWSTIATWTRGVNINNGTFYNATVTLTQAQYTFATNSGFRFQNDASGNNDQIFIDQVTITGTNSSKGTVNNLVAVGSVISSEEGFEEDFLLHPNPVKGNLVNIKLPDSNAFTYRIMNMMGQTILKGESQGQINVSSLKSGMYFIEINDGEEIMTKKFIRR